MTPFNGGCFRQSGNVSSHNHLGCDDTNEYADTDETATAITAAAADIANRGSQWGGGDAQAANGDAGSRTSSRTGWKATAAARRPVEHTRRVYRGSWGVRVGRSMGHGYTEVTFEAPISSLAACLHPSL